MHTVSLGRLVNFIAEIIYLFFELRNITHES